jgi:hypothetical protein
MIVANLYASIDTCPNASSDSGIKPSSSTHEAVPLVETTDIFLSVFQNCFYFS